MADDGAPRATWRHTLASLCLLGVVGIMVAANLPVTRANQQLGTVGLEQGWDVFAPDPVSAHVELEAVVDLADGTARVWHPPRANAPLAAAAYHWDMWARTVLLGPSPMADATARRVAADYRDDGTVVRVTLRRRWFTVPPPGTTLPRRWHESDFYVLELER